MRRIICAVVLGGLMCMLSACGGKAPADIPGKSLAELVKHFENSGMNVKVVDNDLQYKTGAEWKNARMYNCRIGLGIYRLVKFDLDDPKHVEELERLKKEKKVEISRAAAGLKQPLAVNGPFVLILFMGEQINEGIKETFMQFDPGVGGTEKAEEKKEAAPEKKDGNQRGVLKEKK